MFWEILIGIWVISTIVLVLLENRHPVKTLAWMMVLVFLPVVGLVLFFLFGMGTRGKGRILVSDEDKAALARLAASTRQSDYQTDRLSDNSPATAPSTKHSSDSLKSEVCKKIVWKSVSLIV